MSINFRWLYTRIERFPCHCCGVGLIFWVFDEQLGDQTGGKCGSSVATISTIGGQVNRQFRITFSCRDELKDTQRF